MRLELAPQLVQLDNQRGNGKHRITAHLARRCSRMGISPTANRATEAQAAPDVCDDPKRHVLQRQNGTLFDMRFQKHCHVFWIPVAAAQGDIVNMPACRCDSLPQGHAVARPHHRVQLLRR